MLEIEIAGIKFKNPIMPASGTFGYGTELKNLVDISKLGAVVTKGISLVEKPGNPGPRIFETSSGMLNSIGLQNIGFERFVNFTLPKLKNADTNIIVNFFGDNEAEYFELSEKLSAYEQIAALEANISCPNIQKGGIHLGKKPKSVESLVRNIVKRSKKPVFVKITPDVTSIAEIALACEQGGASAIVCANTLSGTAIDIEKRQFYFKNKFAGLSGPAIKPIALKNVYLVSKSVKIPVIGVGGIRDYKDVIEFLLVGASACQIGTENLTNPQCMPEIISNLNNYLENNKINSLNRLIGKIQ
ncbi:MAG: dihydroorotate dehydrogenase [Pseudomonadota bacterium]